MKLRPDGKVTYVILLDPKTKKELKDLHRDGVNFQTKVRKFIQEIIKDSKKTTNKGDSNV